MPDPLVGLLKSIRKLRGMPQKALEECMKLPEGTYRHIERERRKLPDYRYGLVDWIKLFLNCVEATEEERKAVFDCMAQEISLQFSRVLDEQ